MNTWEDPLSLSREDMRTLVRLACDYKNGIGADGMILINQPRAGQEPTPAFRMDFYNPDGSTGMLCGNGARAAVQAAKACGLVSNSSTVNFEVLGAVNRAEFFPHGSIRVFFQDPREIRLEFQLPLEEDAARVLCSYVDLGSQHAVVFFDELQKLPLLKKEGKGATLEELNVAQYGALLRWHPEFAPLGANANFIEVREDGEERYLRIRTFERGVEGETMACGTGCMASAIVALRTGRIANTPIRLLTQSGEFVTVNFSDGDRHISHLSLEGPVLAGEEGTPFSMSPHGPWMSNSSKSPMNAPSLARHAVTRAIVALVLISIFSCRAGRNRSSRMSFRSFRRIRAHS